MNGSLTKGQLDEIRKWLQSRPDTQQKGAKYTKAHSLRTQENVARSGKSARHPLCLAALEVWRQDAELEALTKAFALSEEDVSSAKRQKGQAQNLYKQFCKEQKEKEAIEASLLLRTIDELLLEAQKRYQATVKLLSIHQGWRKVAVTRLEHESDVVIRTGDINARRALQRVRKRWITNETPWGDSDRRTLEILKMLRDELVKATWARDGPAAGYWEAATVGDRALSDEAFKGRLTAREIQSRLKDAPGDRDAKEVRRLARKLGIILAEDQRGRKQKARLPKQRICPGCLKRELEPKKHRCRFCGIRANLTLTDFDRKSLRRFQSPNAFWCPSAGDAIKHREAENEIARLERLQRKRTK
jgi:rRNA maturation endonuclease Nob1